MPGSAAATDGEPAIAIDPESLSVTRPFEGSPRTETILVSNSGDAELEWSVEPAEESWLEVMTPSGTTAPGGSSWLAVELDPAGMEASEHTTTMVITSNATNAPTLDVPVALTIEPEIPVPDFPSQKLYDVDGARSDYFGRSVALDGNTVVVGANGKNIRDHNNQGAAYVFVRTSDGWEQQAMLTADDAAASDQFGTAVDISDDTVVITAPGAEIGEEHSGAVYLFTRSGDSWTQHRKLTATDGTANDSFGEQVAVSGDRVVIGAPRAEIDGNTNQGAAYVFVQNGDEWTEHAKLHAAQGQEYAAFGDAVDLLDDVAVIGAPSMDVDGAARQGVAHVFTYSDGVWDEQATLVAEDGSTQSWFGSAIAIDGETVLIGAESTDGDEQQQGAAYVFTRDASGWQQQARLDASDGGRLQMFGTSVALSGDTAVIGAHRANDSRGAAYRFGRSDGQWEQLDRLIAEDGQNDDQFGLSVALGPSTAIAGAWLAEAGDTPQQGAVYAFWWEAPPGISIDPAQLEAHAGPGEEVVEEVSITNTGEEDLTWSIEVAGGSCAEEESVSWLSVEPDAGATAHGQTDEIKVTLDASRVPEDEHEGLLCIASNAPGAELVEIPVFMTVEADDEPDPETELVSVEVSRTEVELAIGDTAKLTATAVYDDATTKDVTQAAMWSSTDDAIATVDGGLVTGMAEGAATVTATYEDEAGEATVLVTAEESSEPEPDPEPEPTPSGGLARLSGEGRIETAIAISEERFGDGEADAAVLARADEFPDALSGSALATVENGPLLITSSDNLVDIVSEEINRALGAGGVVHLVGGSAALAPSVEQQIDDLGYDVVRHAGATRFETAGVVAAALGEVDHALVTTGLDFPDALTAGTVAGAYNGVVLLNSGEHRHEAVDNYLDEFDGQVWAVGGPAARAYPNAEGVFGPTRDETAVAVAEAFFETPTAFGVARRDDYPDALAGGAHIAAWGGPLLLSYTDGVPEETAGWLTGQDRLTDGFVYGGTAALSDDTFNELEQMAFE